MKNIKYLISCDTSIAHLAGTLKIPTFLLLSKNPNWTWGMEINNKKFYPNHTILQQVKSGDWHIPVKKLEKILRI